MGLIFVLLASLFAFAAAADEIPEERQLPLLVDDADLLSDTEEAKLLAFLESVRARTKCDIAIGTVPSLEGKSAQAYADDFYDYNGYGYGAGDDGALFLIAMSERRWAISSYGVAHAALTDPALDEIEDKIVPCLSDGEYYDAFGLFAGACDSYIRYYRSPDSVEADDPWIEAIRKTPNYLLITIFSLGIGLIITLIVVGSMKSKLKSVKFQGGANAYVVPNSLVLTGQSDVFLYKNVSRVRRETSSSSSGGGGSHTSSSGRSHGGRSGGF